MTTLKQNVLLSRYWNLPLLRNCEVMLFPLVLVTSQDSDSKEDSSERDSIDALCQNQHSAKSKDSSPNYMRPTASSNRRAEITREENYRKSVAANPKKYRPSIVEPLKSEEVPRFMRPTASFVSRTSVVPTPAPVRSSQIKEVDPSNCPRYMRETLAYRRSVAPEPPKQRISATQIREVDPQNMPRYMQVTEAYKKSVESSGKSEPVPSHRIKEVDPSNLPRYMQSTKAYTKLLEPIPEEPPVRRIPAEAIREVDTASLPHDMLPTKAAQQHIPETKQTKSTVTSQVTGIVRLDAATRPSQRYMRETMSFGAMLKNQEEERKQREARRAEQVRQRNSLAVRREKWSKNVKMAESVAIRRKEKVRQEIQNEHSLPGNVPRYMQKSKV